MKILFTGGGTGGHIFPIVSVCREIKSLQISALLPSSPDHKKRAWKGLGFYYIGPKDSFSEIFLFQEGIEIKSIFAGKLRRYSTPLSIIQNFIDIVFRFPIGIVQAFLHIFFIAPDLIFSKGGFGSLPVTIAGRLLSVPIFLHESDVVPGLANKISSRFASIIFTSFPKTEYFPLRKIILAGAPVRKDLLQGSKEEAERIFELTREKPLILILGGSQGSQRINYIILEILPELLENFELIHQCGDQNYKQIEAEANVVMNEEFKKYYHLTPFIKEDELRHAFEAADLIVSRAGSNSIFEIAAVGKPSILIPLPESAQAHQLKNAYAYILKNRALVLEEENLTPRFFLDRLKDLFSHPQMLDEMGEEAKNFARPEAAEIIAQNLMRFLSG